MRIQGGCQLVGVGGTNSKIAGLKRTKHRNLKKLDQGVQDCNLKGEGLGGDAPEQLLCIYKQASQQMRLFAACSLEQLIFVRFFL